MTEAPFGTYALPARLESLRRFGQELGTGAIARRLTSLIRRICLTGRPDPIDVEPFPGQKARLHPRDNLSEKRVFGASQFWDAEEREALALHRDRCESPFAFVDAGANVGLYTLAVRSKGPIQGVAIEPDPENLRRLRFNLEASDSNDVVLADCALSDTAGQIELAVVEGNRGEISGAGAQAGETVTVASRPLLDVVRDAGFTRIDALKIDIEGMELPVLKAFFSEAPEKMHPGMIILEARRGEETPALAFLRQRRYMPVQRTKMNVILTPQGEQKELSNGQA
ncbi:MAG: FkbM family methyltransferase [Pseudomonadota bacterium]